MPDSTSPVVCDASFGQIEEEQGVTTAISIFCSNPKPDLLAEQRGSGGPEFGAPDDGSLCYS